MLDRSIALIVRRDFLHGNPHGIERAMNKHQGGDEEKSADAQLQGLIVHVDRHFHGEQTEERGEFNDRIQRHRGSVLERIADRVAHDGCRVEGGALLFHVHLDNFLGVVPRAAGVRNENGLIQSEERDADQIADEEIRIKKRQLQGQA